VAPVPARWTATTWNIHGSEHPDIARVAEVLQVEAPDLVLLQEVRQSQAAELARRTSMRFTWALKHFPHTRLAPWLAEGLAIMTPHSLDAAAHTEISNGERPSSWKRRIAQWALVAQPDGSTVRAYNVHLSPHVGGADDRRIEAVRLAALVTEHGTLDSVVVGGDFNDHGDNAVIDALPGIEHLPSPPTSPSAAPTKYLDHVLVPIDATGVSVTVPAGDEAWATISDHVPVTVRFTLGRTR
jgi:endonuclease/exonuclease/phosphatase family metal-dependent hydrolase